MPAIVRLVPQRIEVSAPRNGRPGYRWKDAYLVPTPTGLEYPPLGYREAVRRAKEIHGADAVIVRG